MVRAEMPDRADQRQKWALILGASSGFGEATALALSAAGYDICGVHLDRRQGMAHVDEIKAGIEANGRQQTAHVRGDGSYLSHNDTRAHFGLGTATRVTRVEIRWPSGLVESATGLDVDRFYVAREGAGVTAANP